ncbi:MAG: nucleotidyltransferase family protein [Saprospiraceae bacterium]|nr:nucleotidyltransferase family protein [Saprospiraceae bacterium]
MPEQGSNIAIIVLAAGASTRLGQPKQLLRLGEKPLLAQICETALSIENQQVIVVLGANCEAIKPAVEHLPVEIIFNEKWPEGMGESIACGMSQLRPDAGAVLLLLCDQPFVTTDFLKELVEKWRNSPVQIVASSYAGTFGPPAIFGQKLFPELAALHGQQGAKKLMEKHRPRLALVDFPDGAVDIDLPEDWERVRK